MTDAINAEIRGVPELKRKLSILEVKALPKAMTKTLNSVARTVRAEQARAIKDAMGLSRVGDVKRRISVRKARPNRLAVRLTYEGRPLNLISFKGRPLKAGVKAKPWGETKTFRGTFIANIGGNKLVFRRQRKGGRRVGRLPIEAMWGPGIADTAARDDIQRIREQTVARVLTERLRSNLDFEVSKIVKRR